MNTLKIKSESKEIPLYSKNKQLVKLLDRRLLVQSHTFIHLIDLDKIAFLKAASNYTHIVMTDKSSVLSSKTLKSFENKLIDHNFLRVHSSFLVNFEKVRGIKRNGMYKLVLENEVEIPVSNSCRKELFSLVRNGG
jgi:two-component system LytT family response regulator